MHNDSHPFYTFLLWNEFVCVRVRAHRSRHKVQDRVVVEQSGSAAQKFLGGNRKEQ